MNLILVQLLPLQIHKMVIVKSASSSSSCHSAGNARDCITFSSLHHVGLSAYQVFFVCSKVGLSRNLEQQTNQPTNQPASQDTYMVAQSINSVAFVAHNSSLFFSTLSNPAHKDQITTDYYNIINWIIEKMSVDKTKTFRQICVSDTRKE